MELCNRLLAISLLCTALDASALTLGRARGAAIVGQPLDVTVQVQLDADETASALCLEADVFHADTRVEGGRVRVLVEAAAQPQVANVRITSSAYVDEPVVTVYLKAGCGQKSTRRYVLLADFPSEPAPAASVTSAAAAASLPLVVPAGSGATVGNSSGGAPAAAAARSALDALPPRAPVAVGTKPAATPQPAARPAQERKAAAKPPKTDSAKGVAKPDTKSAASSSSQAATTAKPDAKTPADDKLAAGRTAGQSRLKLDPLVLLADRVATLESSSSSAPVVDVSRDAARVQSLEDSVKALVALATKNETSLQDMRVRLQQSEAERLPTKWFYALLALVLACLAAIAYLWSRLSGGTSAAAQVRRKDDWWSGSRGAPLSPSGVAGQPEALSEQQIAAAEAAALAEKDSTPAQLAAKDLDYTARQKADLKARLAQVPSSLRRDPDSEMDVSLVEMSESNFDNLMQSDKSHSALRKGPLPTPVDVMMTAVQPIEQVRSINSEQLFDIRQQAEFFVSLGQTDQAVRILESRINEHGESSPLIYLDLLKIFHSLNLKTDFRQFREDFNLLFNGRVPEFSQFKDEGRDLEAYPHVLAHITALWATPKAQMVIEASIFRDPLDDKSPPFELAAFRDLLLLHAIGQYAMNREAGASDLAPLGGGSGAAFSPQALRAPLPATMPVKSPSPVGVPQSATSGGLVLDLDLSDLVDSPTAPLPVGLMNGAHEAGPSDFPPLVVSNVPAPAVADGKAVAPAPPLVDDDFLSFDLPEQPTRVVSPKPKR